MNPYMNNTNWQPVKGYEGCYAITENGEVKSLARYVNGKHGVATQLRKERILKQRIGKFGYAYVILSVDGIKKTKKIHRMVAEIFVLKQNNCNVVNHLDGNKLNNHYTNLEWTNNDGNMVHAVSMGLIKRGEESPRAILSEQIISEIRMLFNKGIPRKEICLMYSLNRFRIHDIVRYRTWKHVIV